MNAYAAVDPAIESWARTQALILSASPWSGAERRCVWLSSQDGECFQIWVEPPADGVVRLYAAGVDSRRDDDPPHDWAAPVDKVSEALEAAYALVLHWMLPSTHHHPAGRS